MSIYNVDFDKVVRLYAAVRKRKPQRLAWLRTIAWGVKTLYNQFMTYMAGVRYELDHNGQVCYLEAALNDVFDNELRRIYIGDPEYRDPLFVYRDDEERPVYLALDSELPVDPADYEAPVYLWTDEETSRQAEQFIVYVPAAVVYDEVRMRALIDKYRLASKSNYLIETF